MQHDEREQFHEELWKSQEVSQLQMTTEEVCAKAHKLERRGVRMYWAIFAFLAGLTLLYLYRLMQFHQPWLISGTLWAIGSLCYIIWRLIRNGPARMRAVEPCLHFLVREFEAKRRGSLLMRQLALLFVPTILAMWLGGGPALGSKAFGIQSPWFLRLLEGPALLIAMALIIAFVWFAFSREARKASREIEKLKML